MSVEESFGIPQISEDEIRGIQTVGDLVAYVEKALG